MEERPNIWKNGLNSGLIVGLVLVIFSFILYLTHLQQNRLLSNLSFLILLGGIIWAHLNYKKSGDGYMSYGEALGVGTIVSGVTGLFNGVFVLIYNKFVEPDLMERTVQEQIVVLQDQGMSRAQIEQFQDIMSFIQSPIALFFITFLSFVFFGFIFSLIISAFTKKANPTQY
jgi:hypothetical protein